MKGREWGSKERKGCNRRCFGNGRERGKEVTGIAAGASGWIEAALWRKKRERFCWCSGEVQNTFGK